MNSKKNKNTIVRHLRHSSFKTSNFSHVPADPHAPFNSRKSAADARDPDCIARSNAPLGNAFLLHVPPSSTVICSLSCDFLAKCNTCTAYQASAFSSQRLPTKTTPVVASPASATRTITPHHIKSDSPFASSRTAYTGIRHLLNASDINTENYPDSSWNARQGGTMQSASIEDLFADAGGGMESTADGAAEG